MFCIIEKKIRPKTKIILIGAIILAWSFEKLYVLFKVIETGRSKYLEPACIFSPTKTFCQIAKWQFSFLSQFDLTGMLENPY